MKRCCSCFFNDPVLVQCKMLVTKNNHHTQCKRVASFFCNKCKKEFCYLHFSDNSIICEKCISEEFKKDSRAKKPNFRVNRNSRLSRHSNCRRSIELSISSTDSIYD